MHRCIPWDVVPTGKNESVDGMTGVIYTPDQLIDSIQNLKRIIRVSEIDILIYSK